MTVLYSGLIHNILLQGYIITHDGNYDNVRNNNTGSRDLRISQWYHQIAPEPRYLRTILWYMEPQPRGLKNFSRPLHTLKRPLQTATQRNRVLPLSVTNLSESCDIRTTEIRMHDSEAERREIWREKGFQCKLHNSTRCRVSCAHWRVCLDWTWDRTVLYSAANKKAPRTEESLQ